MKFWSGIRFCSAVWPTVKLPKWSCNPNRMLRSNSWYVAGRTFLIRWTDVTLGLVRIFLVFACCLFSNFFLEKLKETRFSCDSWYCLFRPNMQLKLSSLSGRVGNVDQESEAAGRNLLLPYPPRPTTRRGLQDHSGSDLTDGGPRVPGLGGPDVGMLASVGGGGTGSSAGVGVLDNTSSSSSALSYSLPASAFRTSTQYNPNVSSSASTNGNQPRIHHPITSQCVSGQIQVNFVWPKFSDQMNAFWKIL